MHRRLLILGLLLILTTGASMRALWLRADPPVQGGVGIVWHDEGAWVHNARNRVLWGTWRTDDWNPVFVSPVFTALEYVAFEGLGVGTWQARVVPVLSGLAAVALLMIGLAAVAGPRTAVMGGALLATNYAFIMWNRAALMESTMTACMVAAWAAYALADRRPAWGLVAGAAATAAWFTKASAAFFLAAIALDALLMLWTSFRGTDRQPGGLAVAEAPAYVSAGLCVLAGMGVTFGVVTAFFVFPNWTEYQFYNWQMSVTRKPEYSIDAFVDRASWLPLVQSIFSRMWIELVGAAFGLLAIVVRLRSARPAERLLVLWLLLGLVELVVHDTNERRFVMFIPALAALAALFADRALSRQAAATAIERPPSVPVALCLTLLLGYLVAGGVARVLLLDQIEANNLKTAVRLSALSAVVFTACVFVWRRRVFAWLSAPRVPGAAVMTLFVLALTGQFLQYGLWAQRRTSVNYDAAVALGRLLPPGTLVQGKLANGLALENRIRPLFVGNGFGNYADRLRRDDARYILTYDLPQIGYESSQGSGLIQGILDHYPRQRVVATFHVDETPVPDRAALIDKFPDDPTAHARD